MSEALLPIEREESGPHAGVVTVWLSQPGRPVVVLEAELIDQLSATLDSVGEARGLVLASESERVFVAGADLKAIQELSDEQLSAYLAHASGVFGKLAAFPFPTAAAINGAALGGGLELAMHCDGLIAAPSASGKPYPVGLPEAGLKICPGWGGTNLLPARIDAADGIRRTAVGRPLKFDEAVESGLFDRVCDAPGELLATAKAWVCEQASPTRDGAPLRWVGRDDCAASTGTALASIRGEIEATPSGVAVAAAVDAGLSSGWKAALASEQDSLVRLRAEPAGKEAIEAFFARA